MLPILPDTAWLEFRGASAKKGQNKTTHQALVVDAAGREHKCFVKASPDEYPMAFAEGLAWMPLALSMSTFGHAGELSSAAVSAMRSLRMGSGLALFAWL